MHRRNFWTNLVGITAGLCVLTNQAFAQTAAWPQRPIKFVVSFAPGGPADIVGRLLGQAL